MNQYPYVKDAFTYDDIVAHVNRVLNGEVGPLVKSEPVQADDQTHSVVIVRGQSFESIVYETEQSVLLEFYAPWCGHCKQLEPIYQQVAEHFQSNRDKVIIGKIDATANEVEAEGVEITGFPTLYFFSKENKLEPIEYEGERTVEDIIEFVENQLGTEVQEAEQNQESDHSEF